MWQMSKNELVRERGIGRPSVLDESVCNEIDRMLCDSPDLQVSEVLRRLRSDLGYVFGKTPVYDYVRTNRPKKGQLPIVCFEGVAGEFAQHDFGELVMVYDDGASEKIHFYAGRLKYSRYMHVSICKDQQIESVIRGMLSFADEIGGMALVNVWDRPKTVVTGVVADAATVWIRTC